MVWIAREEPSQCIKHRVSVDSMGRSKLGIDSIDRTTHLMNLFHLITSNSSHDQEASALLVSYSITRYNGGYHNN